MSLFSHVFISIILCSFSLCSYAAGLCTGSTQSKELTMPLNASIYAGEDIPIGTILYTLYFSTPLNNTGALGYIDVSCTQPITRMDTIGRVSSEPMGGAFSFSGNPFNGSVYKTNIDGIGVAFILTSSPGNISPSTVTSDTPQIRTSSYSNGSLQAVARFHTSIYFVKTGPVSGAGRINGSSVPALSYTLANPTPSSLSGFPMTGILRLRLSGGININSSTCEAVNKVVNLGGFNSRDFTRKGSVSPWVDSSIELVNCPSFSGFYSAQGFQTSNGAPPVGGTITHNALLISAVPNTGVFDDNAGIMNIERSGSSALGLGIQLGYGNSSNSVPWVFSQLREYIPGNGAGSSVKIPMVARYYQTEDLVTPGRADGVLTYTINYN